MAQGTRNTTNPMIHHPNAAGPADWMTAALVMNKTIATKIATMSNVVSTLGRMPPATRSEISVPDAVSVSVSAAMATPPGVGGSTVYWSLGLGKVITFSVRPVGR